VTTPRIAPVDPPYAPELQAAFDRIMKGQPPLLLFRTMARNPRVLERMVAGALLDRGSITIRTRELMILRTTARCGAEYEWGVHVALFGDKVPWTNEEVYATVHGTARDACWSPEDRVVVRLADQLHDTTTVDDVLWEDLSVHYGEEQLIELIVLAGLYRAVSCLVNATGVLPEAFAPRFPGQHQRTPTTERLVWRATTSADLEFVLGAEGAEDTAAFVLGWSREQHRRALDDASVAHGILETRSAEPRPLGFVMLAGVDPPGGSVEFRRIVVQEKGRGLGREAVRLVKREVFDRFRAHRLWLDVFEDNPRARALYASEGFIVEGTLREHVHSNGRWRSLVVMSMLRREYSASFSG
jgi:RimJ/RimL family protein N-acetyltransferase/alkylhydroperoxidase family enzyme